MRKDAAQLSEKVRDAAAALAEAIHQLHQVAHGFELWGEHSTLLSIRIDPLPPLPWDELSKIGMQAAAVAQQQLAPGHRDDAYRRRLAWAAADRLIEH